MKKLPLAFILLALIGGGIAFFLNREPASVTVLSGNGRIESTEIDVATKLPGRLEEMLVQEGDFVKAGQVLARIRSVSLDAELAAAQAKMAESEDEVITAEAQVEARKSERDAAEATITQREAELAAIEQRLERSENLSQGGAVAKQQLDDDRAAVKSSAAAVAAAKAQKAAAAAAIRAAEAQVGRTKSAVKAAQAAVARVQSDIDECTLRSPRDGRVQYRIAQIGEVLGVGGKVLNLVDLTDVYMTFFLPETVAGKIAIGSEVRIVLDALPDHVIPAKVSYVASVAQFTPKSVETASERQKLMFRVKGQIDPVLLKKYIERVKTGLPGVAYVNLGESSTWPSSLEVTLSE